MKRYLFILGCLAVGVSSVGCGTTTNNLGRTRNGYYDDNGMYDSNGMYGSNGMYDNNGTSYTSGGASYWDTDSVTQGRTMTSLKNTFDDGATDVRDVTDNVKYGLGDMMNGTTYEQARMRTNTATMVN